MFAFTKKEKKQRCIDGLLLNSTDGSVLHSLENIQNGVCVSFNTKVIGICSIDDDCLSSAFTEAFALSYEKNGESTLIVDANLYNSSLLECLRKGSRQENTECINNSLFSISDLTKGIILSGSTLPSQAFKNGILEDAVELNRNKFDHILVILPNLKTYKDVLLVKSELDCIVVVAQKNVTKKIDVFNAAQFIKENSLSLGGFIIVK